MHLKLRRKAMFPPRCSVRSTVQRHCNSLTTNHLQKNDTPLAADLFLAADVHLWSTEYHRGRTLLCRKKC
jgi:hypothetical protein